LAEASDVRAVWTALGLPGIIDVHTHFMPERVMDKVWAYFDTAGPLTGREWPIAYDWLRKILYRNAAALFAL
jgi:uncharacterized protein